MCTAKIKPISFWQLINQCSINIPIIQRDYVQGRKDSETSGKRDRFLNALHVAILDETKPQTLDFIYGQKSGDTLEPLDGQQRLTTLFLLHWFIATKEGKMDDSIKKILSKFTYRTRTSSREFCESLINAGCVISNESISNTIQTKTNWWVLGWKHDPTISAMLCMLDAIQSKFVQADLWRKLIAEQITLINIPLQDFGLSDDLYVKMNSRGKELTLFENWKAEFEKYISINNWEAGVEIIESFALKIDTVWCDLFWEYKISKNIDAQLINFIRRAQFVSVIFNRQLDEGVTLDNFPYYEPCKYQKEDFDYLYTLLDLWCRVDKKSPLKLFDEKSNQNIFQRFIGDKITYSERVLFVGQTLALQRGLLLNSNQSLEWMRVVRNIVENSTIDSIASFKGAVSLINEISVGCSDIYLWLSSNVIASGFSSAQVKEEQIKARLICYNHEWKSLIFECEDVELCRGRINFALKCVDYNDDPVYFESDNFRKALCVIKEHFSGEITIELWRAFFTIEDHKFYNCWSSWSHAVNCRKRWIPKSLDNLRAYCNNQYSENLGSAVYAVGLVKLLMNTDLHDYIENYTCQDSMPKWKQKLIKSKSELKKCTNGYLCVSDNDSKCWLIDGTRPSDISKYHKV